ncbi:rhodanese-like/PpiC domain-containing protein 12, chloroplastic isoform X2 [Phragmites australis]|uniref:rhodanese-like/PpiC domain-containing protein 12, chloroplastic isoform X2 n=1 Tax=Phragmites australis TaxID=29695 RepID=UPI002D7997A4|nr:rhodanese-like/PpiC domain-containing protein 12, chloroplastic isoform X2 [Phragmites australis]
MRGECGRGGLPGGDPPRPPPPTYDARLPPREPSSMSASAMSSTLPLALPISNVHARRRRSGIASRDVCRPCYRGGAGAERECGRVRRRKERSPQKLMAHEETEPGLLLPPPPRPQVQPNESQTIQLPTNPSPFLGTAATASERPAMLGLRARAAARLPCPSPSPYSAATARFTRLSPLAPLSSASPPPRTPRPSLSTRWRLPMRPGGTGSYSRPTTRVFCTAASSPPREGKELLVQHLLVGEKDVRLLVDLEKSIIAGGADLSDLAVVHSLCPSKENGGMLGWVRRGQMVPEFEEAAFGAPLNKVVRCTTKFGWHLLQVLAERDQCILQDIEPEELHTKMQDPSFVEEAQLIDVREPDEVYTTVTTQFSVVTFPIFHLFPWSRC